MRLLDLFCCAGGAAMGYYRAGFTEITGIDIRPQPRYPFRFIQADALEYLAEHGHEYDVIHASPPCQAHSDLAHLHRSKGTDYDERHKDLIPQTRALLQAIGKPYIIENVEGAPLTNSFTLCGAMFGLKVYRHRLFETSFFAIVPPHIAHHDNTPAVGRGISSKGFISVTGVGGFGIPNGFGYACSAMGIDWMSRPELSQAIPPAYTQWIGERLLEQMEVTHAHP